MLSIKHVVLDRLRKDGELVSSRSDLFSVPEKVRQDQSEGTAGCVRAPQTRGS